MAFNVNSFKANVFGDGKGYAKQSNYEMFIIPPTNILLSDNAKAAVEPLRFRIESAELPGRSIITTDYKRHGYGLTNKIGYGVVYPDVSVTMICDNNLGEKRFFNAWQSMIVGNHTRQQDYKKYSSVGYYQRYIGTAAILQYSDQSEEDNPTPIYTLGLAEAYPIIVNSMPLQWGGEDFHRLTVQFTYKYFQELDEPAQGFEAVGGGGRGGISISGLPSFDDVLSNFGLPGIGQITGNPIFNTNSFTLR